MITVDGSCFVRDAPLCDLWTPAVPRCYFRHCSRFLVSVVLIIRTNTRLELARLWISVSQEGITKHGVRSEHLKKDLSEHLKKDLSEHLKKDFRSEHLKKDFRSEHLKKDFSEHLKKDYSNGE